MKVWLSADAFARALGAEDVAEALRAEAARRGTELELIRTGSRGMAWLEPLAEVEVDGVRHAFGPLGTADVGALFGEASELALGPTEEIAFFKAQTRLTFARCGVIDPLSAADFAATGGGIGLARARQIGAAGVLDELKASGLRGRGGAGFPAGIKWATVAGAPGPRKYIVCNADEGDSGSFADRMLMEGDPLALIEGMAIAAFACGADKGYIYLRSEYPDAIAALAAALPVARRIGLLDQSFDIEVRIGAGAYICGEETSLLNSLEGKRGVVRAKPPLPALEGAFGKPTLVHNVLTLAAVPHILTEGGAAYAAHGEGRSAGTIPVQLAGNIRHGGLFEAPFGMSLRQLVDEIGGGTASGRPVRAVQVGGPLGAYFPASMLDTPFTYEALDAAGGLLGHAGITVFDDTVDMGAQARFAMEFCAIESCGKCTPCRIGAVRGVETIDRLLTGDAAALPILTDLCETMKLGSLCALGGFTPFPVMSALTHFPEDFPLAREAAE